MVGLRRFAQFGALGGNPFKLGGLAMLGIDPKQALMGPALAAGLDKFGGATGGNAPDPNDQPYPARPNPQADYSGMDAQIAALADRPPEAAPVPGKKAGFFGKGGGAWSILGHVGDQLAGNDSFATLQQASVAEQIRQRKAADDVKDAMALKQWEWANKPEELPGIAKEAAWYQGLPQNAQQGGGLSQPMVNDYLKLRFPAQQAGPPPANVGYGATVTQPGQPGAPGAGAGSGEMIADGPNGPIRYNPQTGQWEPLRRNIPMGSPLNPNLGR